MNSFKGAGMDRKVRGEGQASEEDWKVWFSSTMFQYYNGGQFEFQKNIIDMAAESLWQMLYQIHLTKWGNQDFRSFFVISTDGIASVDIYLTLYICEL